MPRVFVLWCVMAMATAAGTQAPPAAKPADKSPAAKPAAGGSPATKSPSVRPVFENDIVRVLEVVWEPGAAVPSSRRAGGDLGVAGVVARGGTVEHTDARGKKTRRERRPGEVLWEGPKANIDARQNVGAANINVIQVRLKKAPPMRAYTGPAAGLKPTFENKNVAAFDVGLAPKAALPIHKYAPRVWVVLEGGHLRSTDQAGKKQEARVSANQVMWFDPQEQIVENIGAAPFRAISLELK